MNPCHWTHHALTVFLIDVCFFVEYQVFGTAMLLLCLWALFDQRNKPALEGSEPVAVGLLVLLIGMSLGSNSGYAINPTRDLGPRIFTAIAGWGTDVFRYARNMHWLLAEGIFVTAFCCYELFQRMQV